MDEFPDSPRAEEPLLEHTVDVEGLEPRRSLNRSRSGTPGHRVLTIRSNGGTANTVGSLPRQQSTMTSTPEAGGDKGGDKGGGGGGSSGGAEGQSPVYALAVRSDNGTSTNWKNDAVHELEVEILTEAVADAVADAVGEIVQDAVQDAVQTAMEDARFDFKANLNTLVAVTAAVLLERGVWNTWDFFFGDESLVSNLGSLVVGLTILIIIRILNLPLASTVPGRAVGSEI